MFGTTTGYKKQLWYCVAAMSLPVRGMMSTQSTVVGGGRKMVPSLQQQQQLAVVSSQVEQPSNLAELLLGNTLNVTYRHLLSAIT